VATSFIKGCPTPGHLVQLQGLFEGRVGIREPLVRVLDGGGLSQESSATEHGAEAALEVGRAGRGFGEPAFTHTD
jgi:hypothetical protein